MAFLLVWFAVGYGLQWVFTGGAGPWRHDNVILFALMVYIVSLCFLAAPGSPVGKASRPRGHAVVRVLLGIVACAAAFLALGFGLVGLLPIEPKDVNHAIQLGYFEYAAWMCLLFLLLDQFCYRRFRIVREHTVVLMHKKAYWPGERFSLNPFATHLLTGIQHPFYLEISEMTLPCTDGTYQVSVATDVLVDFRGADLVEPQIAGTSAEVYEAAQAFILRKLQERAREKTLGQMLQRQLGAVLFDAAGVPLIWDGSATITLKTNA